MADTFRRVEGGGRSSGSRRRSGTLSPAVTVGDGARTANGIEEMPLANMMVSPWRVPMRPRGGVVTAITNDVRFDVFRVFLCSLRGGRSERVP